MMKNKLKFQNINNEKIKHISMSNNLIEENKFFEYTIEH